MLEETGLLPHLNPGVLTWAELQRLKPVAPSMGMMLETTATRLWSEPGGPHYGSPDKEPAVRLRVLDDAGRVGVPFTTGILIGIGETPAERAESLFAIRRIGPRVRPHPGSHRPELPRQAGHGDARRCPTPSCTTWPPRSRWPGWCSGPRARIQAPPNLIDGEYDAAAAGRHRRLGRRLAGHARPRQPGAALAADRRAGPALAPRPASRCASG